MNSVVKILLLIVIILAVTAGLVLWIAPGYVTRFVNWVNPKSSGVFSATRMERVGLWLKNPAEHPEWAVHAGERCGDAPFQMPTDGYIGFLWDDSWRPGHRHTGLDIFGGEGVGKIAVYSASDGYLTRLPEWKSSVIIRIPQDPFQPDRQIWTYYTHLADPLGNALIDANFPPGTEEEFVTAGTLLGYQGNYSGTPGSPTGIHLHFSIVLDNGNGRFLNELEIQNTLDPSPYLGIDVNARTNTDQIPVCPPIQETP